MRWTVPLAAVAMLAPLASATAAPVALTASEREAITDAATTALKELNIPGLSIAIARGDSIVFAEGFGATAPGGGTAVTADTRFRIASVSKALTAAAVLRLDEAGKLTLDDPLHARCAAFPEKDANPTIRQLLGHQGGVRHTTDAEDTKTRGAYAHLADAIAPIAKEKLAYAPGTKMVYSSWGYALLGCAIEGASGEAYADYMRANVLEPAGMSATVVDRPDYASPDFSPGWAAKGKKLVPSKIVDTRFKTPASGFVSTAPDLARFAIALDTGKLLDDAHRKTMFTRQTLANGEATNSALGWFVANPGDSGQAYYMTGSMEGVTALLLVVPERGYALAILANRERYVKEIVPLMRKIDALMLGGGL